MSTANTEVWLVELISGERFLEVLPSGLTTTESKQLVNRRWAQSLLVSHCHKAGFTQQEVIKRQL